MGLQMWMSVMTTMGLVSSSVSTQQAAITASVNQATGWCLTPTARVSKDYIQQIHIIKLSIHILL